MNNIKFIKFSHFLSKTIYLCLCFFIFIPSLNSFDFYEEEDIEHNFDPPYPLKKGYLHAEFKTLSHFELKLKEKETKKKIEKQNHQFNKQIPPEILQLNGKKVQIEGFLYPLEIIDGKVTMGVLKKDSPACCFGKIPTLNDMIMVEIEGDGFAISTMSVCVTWGVLEMGDAIYKKNKGGSIYYIKASKIINI